MLRGFLLFVSSLLLHPWCNALSLYDSRVTILVEGRWQFGPVQSFTDLIRLQKLPDDWLLLRDLLEFVTG